MRTAERIARRVATIAVALAAVAGHLLLHLLGALAHLVERFGLMVRRVVESTTLQRTLGVFHGFGRAVDLFVAGGAAGLQVPLQPVELFGQALLAIAKARLALLLPRLAGLARLTGLTTLLTLPTLLALTLAALLALAPPAVGLLTLLALLLARLSALALAALLALLAIATAIGLALHLAERVVL